MECAVAAPGVLENDTDPDGDPLNAELASPASNGTLTLRANGSFAYTPTLGFTDVETFTYHANDGWLDSNQATVTLTVQPASVYLPLVVRDGGNP